MYRTLIKSSRTVMNGKEAVIIDTNALIAKKLEKLASDCIQEENPMQFSDEFAQDLDAERVAALLDDRDLPSLDGEFVEGIPGSSNIIKAATVPQGPTPEELIAQAQEEIALIKQDAMREIEMAKQEAIEAGRKEGYDAGYRQGMQETEQMKQMLEAKAHSMDEAYEAKLKELEPHFIETLTGIYEHVLKVSLAGEMQLIMFLASNAIRNIDGCREFLIHVSKDDYPIVSMQKKQLTLAAGNANASVDVIADSTLQKNGCMIETENGIFDCGLGTQLEELTKQLRLLSYSGNTDEG